MNFGAAREALRRTPNVPQSATVLPFPVPAPAAAPPASSPVASGAPPAAPPSSVSVPGSRWSRYAGTLGAGLTVTVSAAVIRRGGHEPNEPDESDVKLLQEALEEGLRERFGDGPVPWWMGAALAAGGVYASMRVGAAKLPPKVPPVLTNEDPREGTSPLAPPRPSAEPPAPPTPLRSFKLPPAVDGGGGL